MKITFLLWAQIRMAAGASRIEEDVPEGTSLDEAVDSFFRAHPSLRDHRSTARVAVGSEYAAGSRVLEPGDEVSLIPPVQGG
jgi:molybdopterin converting factor small subunit